MTALQRSLAVVLHKLTDSEKLELAMPSLFPDRTLVSMKHVVRRSDGRSGMRFPRGKWMPVLRRC